MKGDACLQQIFTPPPPLSEEHPSQGHMADAFCTTGDRHRWVVLVLFCFYSASNAIQWITYAPIASTVKEYFDLTTNQLNMLSSVYMIVFAAGAYFTCTTFERWGVRRGVLVGCCLNAVGSILKVSPGLQVRNYTVLITSQTLNSLSQLFVLSTPPLIAAQYFAPSQRTLATAIAATANNLGNAIALFAPPLIVRKGEPKEFTALFCGEMGLCCGILIAVFFYLKSPSFKAPSRALLNMKSAPSGRCEEKEMVKTGTAVPTDRQPDGSTSLPPTVYRTTTTTSGEEPFSNSLERSARKVEPLSWWDRLSQHEHVVTFVEVGHTVLRLCRCRDFVFLLCAFSVSMGSVWTYASVLAQVLEPFGVSAQLAGFAGAMNVVVGTVAAYIVGFWVDRVRRYKYPVVVCLTGSVLCCLSLMIILLKVDGFSKRFDVLSVFIYIFAGVFQNTATPICFEFAMEITYPLQESVPGAMLMAGANIVSLIMLSVASAMLGNGVASQSSCVNVLIMITCVCVGGLVLSILPRERLHRQDAEVVAHAQLTALDKAQADGGDVHHPTNTTILIEPTAEGVDTSVGHIDENPHDMNGVTAELQHTVV